jgi:plasmid stabilization system protein ParE
MGHVVWTDPAIADLEEIMDFIARDSPRYALDVGERIYEAAGKLELGPRAGWMVPEFGVDHFREVLMRPYRIIYEIRDGACYIVAVIHGRRELPSHLQPPQPPARE